MTLASCTANMGKADTENGKQRDSSGCETVNAKSLDELVKKNVETIALIEAATKKHRTRSQMLADAVSAYCGSMAFVWVHCAWFGIWLFINTSPVVPRFFRFDPPPFGNLTLLVSLEAIFLSTFILISQNNQERLAETRNHLHLQINLLAEQENSQMLTLLHDIAATVGAPIRGARTDVLSQETDPRVIAEQLDRVEGLETPNPESLGYDH